jgi:hypothetical protein
MPKTAHQFFECGRASFLLAPALDVFQVDPGWLTSANQDRLVVIGARFPVDISGKPVLHTVSRRKQVKFPALDFDFFRSHGKLLADLHRPPWKLKKEMGARRMSKIPGLAWLKAQAKQDFLDSVSM